MHQYGQARIICIYVYFTYTQACIHAYMRTYIHEGMRTYMHTNIHANSFLRLLYKLPLYKAPIQGSSIRQRRCVRAVCRMAVGLIGNGGKKCRLCGVLTRAPGTRAPEPREALLAQGMICPTNEVSVNAMST